MGTAWSPSALRERRKVLSMRDNQQNWRLIAMTIAVGVLGMLVLFLRTHRKSAVYPSPSPIITSMTSPMPVEGTEGAYPTDASMWVSDHEVACFHNGRLGIVDADTGMLTPLTEFYRKAGDNKPNGPFHISMSPDGKWLL